MKWIVIVSIFITFSLSDTLNVEMGNHVVKEGDWLSTISEKHDLSWEFLYYLNKETIGNNPDLLQPSDTLKIPLAYNLEATQYKIEVWLFLILFCILILVIYRKKLRSPNVTVENKNLSTSGNKTKYDVDIYGKDSSTVTEIPIEVPNTVDFKHDIIEGDVKAYKLKTDVNTSDLAKKLKKLKK